MEKRPKVLFLSTGNSTRSQMAEGILRASAGDIFEPVSVGIESTDRDPIAIEVMKEVDIDISRQHSKTVPESFKEHFGFVITVSDPRERAPIFPFTPNLVHWNLEDPSVRQIATQEKKDAFRHAREELRARVQAFVTETSQRYQVAEPAHG